MSEQTLSLVYDANSAAEIFRGLSKERFMLALLATMKPQAAWQGSMVYACPSPIDPESTVCLVCRGEAAEEIQEHLVAAIEERGVRVLQLYEGGLEPEGTVVRVSKDLCWV